MIFQKIFTFPWPVILGIIVVTICEALFLLAQWYDHDTRLHTLRVDSHRLRLQLKIESAERIYEEERYQSLRKQRNAEIPAAGAVAAATVQDTVTVGESDAEVRRSTTGSPAPLTAIKAAA